jgi:acetyltransferase-like isoleucine patch superfamily enzyme
MLYHYAVFGDPARLVIEPGADVNDALFNVSSGTIRVEANAFFGHGVSLLTGTHDIEVIDYAVVAGVPARLITLDKL